MLLYGNNLERDVATTELINKGLEENQLCVYASVDAYDKSHLAAISSKISNYEENINKRNLLVVNLDRFYDSALRGDLTPFKEFKSQIQKELELRSNGGAVIVADCADNLFQNQCFDQSELVENWWHGVYKVWTQHENREQNQITIVCPHLDSLLCKHPYDRHKHRIFNNHSVVIDITGHLMGTSPTTAMQTSECQIVEPAAFPMESQTQILVAEPEPDLQQIYNIWLRSRGFKNILITDSGRTCLDELFKTENKCDIIVILDSHLKDIPVVELAKQIANRKPNNRIIFTTTYPQDIVSSMGINNNNNNNEILFKPFRFPELLSLIGSNTE